MTGLEYSMFWDTCVIYYYSSSLEYTLHKYFGVITVLHIHDLIFDDQYSIMRW